MKKIEFQSVADLSQYGYELQAKRNIYQEQLENEYSKKDKNRNLEFVTSLIAKIKRFDMALLQVELLKNNSLNKTFLELAPEMTIDPLLFQEHNKEIGSLFKGEGLLNAQRALNTASSNSKQLAIEFDKIDEPTNFEPAATVQTTTVTTKTKVDGTTTTQTVIETPHQEVIETREEIFTLKERSEEELKQIVNKVLIDAHEPAETALNPLLKLLKVQERYKEYHLGDILFRILFKFLNPVSKAPIKSWIGRNIYNYTLARTQPVAAYFNVANALPDWSTEDYRALVQTAIIEQFSDKLNTVNDSTEYHRQLQKKLNNLFNGVEDEIKSESTINLGLKLYSKEEVLDKISAIYNFINMAEIGPVNNVIETKVVNPTPVVDEEKKVAYQEKAPVPNPNVDEKLKQLQQQYGKKKKHRH
jgi:hypothetical protein